MEFFLEFYQNLLEFHRIFTKFTRILLEFHGNLLEFLLEFNKRLIKILPRPLY